jgi:hypothetical protein
MRTQNNRAIVNRKAVGVKTASVVAWVFAILCAVLAFIMFIAAVDPNYWEPGETAGTYYPLVALFAIPAAILFWRAIVNQRLIKYYRLFLPLIAADKDGAIDHIARALSLPSDLVCKYLKKMIKKSIFPNAYIDSDTNRIIFTDITGVVTGTAQTAVGFVSKICPGCGAPNNVPISGSAMCAYCGKAL